jgi:hypothetical protein
MEVENEKHKSNRGVVVNLCGDHGFGDGYRQ